MSLSPQVVNLVCANGRTFSVTLASHTDTPVLVEAVRRIQAETKETVEKGACVLGFTDPAGITRHVRFFSEAERQVVLDWVAASRPHAVQQVRIVALPDRETAVSVERNAEGSIVRSTQVERDASGG